MEIDCNSRDNLLCVTDIYIPAYIHCPRDPFGGSAMRFKNYDYSLIILTTLILFAIGVVCVFGITYYNYLAIIPDWTNTIQYATFINEMNSYLYPLLVLLFISLGLCIPKRLLEQDTLIKFSAIVLIITGFLILFRSIETGLSFILVVMTGAQIIILFLILNKNKSLRFEKEGYFTKLGSSFLHLGLVVLILNFVTLRESPVHISIFWGATLSVTVGNIFSFYPDKIASLLHYN